jgi:hypothetical protein
MDKLAHGAATTSRFSSWKGTSWQGTLEAAYPIVIMCNGNHLGTQVGNFRVEPPSLFRGRGEHPKMGKIKQRVYPRDITINIGEKLLLLLLPGCYQATAAALLCIVSAALLHEGSTLVESG